MALTKDKKNKRGGWKGYFLLSFVFLLLAIWLLMKFGFFGQGQEFKPNLNLLENGSVYRTVDNAQIVGTIDFPFKRPFGIAIDANDNLFVSEFYLQKGDGARIIKFSPIGEYLGWIGRGDQTTGWHPANSPERSLPGSGDGEFVGVSKIAFHSDGRAYVVDGGSTDPTSDIDNGNHRLQVFDNDWNFLGWIGKGDKTTGWHPPKSGEKSGPGTEEGALSLPDGLVVTEKEVLVGGWEGLRVDTFSTEGDHLAWLGKAHDDSYGWHATGKGFKPIGSPPFSEDVGAFQAPTGLAMDRFNRLYVVDFASDPVVSVFNFETGNFIWGIWRNAGMRPDNIILDRYGNIILADFNEGSIRFLDKDGKKTATLQIGPGGEYFGAAGFAFDSKGSLYVTEYTQNKVFKIDLVYKNNESNRRF